MKKLSVALVIVSQILISACVSMTGEKEYKRPPVLHGQMPVEEIVDVAIQFGSKTLLSAKKIIKKKKLGKKASAIVRIKIIENFRSWQAPSLINAVNLYQSTDSNKSDEIFLLLAESDRKLARQISWHVARTFASKKMAVAIDQVITNAIENDELNELLVPQLPAALSVNNMKESYSVLKFGLFQTNHDSYAKAMIQLNPKQASSDFLDYLSQAPVEELRQLTMTSLNVYTCVEILNHMLVQNPELSHPKFEHLFLFALSRNMGLSDLARKVILRYLPKETSEVARKLARMANWIQIAFVEGSRRRMTPVLGVMLSELKAQTGERDVIEEINAIRF